MSASRTSSRASSKQSSKNRYRTKATTSHVDESLFGNTNADKSKKDRINEPLSSNEILHFSTGQSLPSKTAKPKLRKPETVRVITKDLIRDVVVPSDNNQNSIILNFSEYNKIKQKAKNTDQEDLEHKKRQQQERDKILEDMQKRKQMMNEYDLKRTENAPISDLEIESRTIAEELLKKAKEKRLEENDEIKHLNELILEAKCHAIRDAQVAEKQELKSHMDEENVRLDAMMEIDRVQGIQQQEEVVKKSKEQRQKGALQILQQIEANQMEKLLENERKENEAKILVQKQKKMQIDDLNEIEKRKRDQKILQAEIDIINAEHQRQKQIRVEQERIAELRVVEYLREKAEKEREAEALVKEQRKEKELEIAKLRAAQEKASDLQAERDALRAKRHEEATEREYRKKAREDAAKKIAMDLEMKEAREEQIRSKQHLMAIHATRERAEFDKSLQLQQKEMNEMATNDKNKFLAQRRYADEVRNQIREREDQRINERKQFFEETINKDKDMVDKKKQLESVKRNKLRELKESGVPEKYVMEVARRIGLSAI